MSVIHHLRSSLGLTLEQLSEYLQVPPSVITMSDSGRRNFPSSVSEKLNRLLTLLQTVQDNQKEKDVPKPISATVVKEVMHNTDWQLKKLQKKLQLMQRKYHQANNFLAIRQMMQAEANGDRLEYLWLEVIAADAETQLAANNLEQQTLLHLDIQVLQYKMGLLAAL